VIPPALILIWLRPFLMIALIVSVLASVKTSLLGRWIAALSLAIVPLGFPQGGILSTLGTGFAVVAAVRLPDLERVRPRFSWEQRFRWLLIPMVTAFEPARAERVSAIGRRAIRRLTLAAAILLALRAITWAPPLFVRSAVMLVFFVQFLTGLADSVAAFSEWTGARTEELFVSPLLATSPRDFWSRRWNRFISRFALRFVALRLPRSMRSSGGFQALAVFFVSGLFHEYFAWGGAREGVRPGTMLLFFGLHGLAAYLGTRWPLLPPEKKRLGWTLTFVWMMLTAPLFFAGLHPPLLELGYPERWLP
jgi:Membrane bound O-acyl transferase family